MASKDVAGLAAEVNASVADILKHFKSLGIYKKSGADGVTIKEREQMLAHLRRAPATAKHKTVFPKVPIVRQQPEGVKRLAESTKTPIVPIVVRRRRTFVQREKQAVSLDVMPQTATAPWDPTVMPETVADYLKWAEVALNSSFVGDDRLQSVYATNSQNILNRVNQHQFFEHFSQKTKVWEAEYEQRMGAKLFTGNADPNLQIKSYESVVEKTFRQNILLNTNFPNQPQKGWLDYSSIYEQFNDLVRGSLVCKFIDGPEFVAKAIVAYAAEHELESRQYSHERDDGYYAYHVYVKFPVSIFDLSFNKSERMVEVEIQLTTQLQEVLRSLTQRHYETERLKRNPDRGKWKWDFSSSRFKVGYLSHALHLLESVILDARKNVQDELDADKGGK